MSDDFETELKELQKSDEEQQIVFLLNGQRYSLDIDLVMAIEQNYVVIPIPEGPANIKGMINLRGEVVPVYSLRSRFNLPEISAAEAANQRLLIVNQNGIHIGFEVDSVSRIERLATGDRKDIPIMLKTESTGYIGGVLAVNNQLCIEISVDNIMAESEWAELEKMIEERSGAANE